MIGIKPGDDYASKIKRLRLDNGLTQKALADQLGVSFATVNRWENGQTKPSSLYWRHIRQLEMELTKKPVSSDKSEEMRSTILDFTAKPEVVKVVAEGERLSFGYLMNPVFATEISNIDPLPHQRIAVYDHMLKQPRLRFLLADDAGAGKTIMSGLYIREMLSRRLLRRILIVPPAGLVGNWRRELLTLFNLPFRLITGSDARIANPFHGENSDRIIVSVDTLASDRMFARLCEDTVAPYDLVIFDEAHKLAADQGKDLRIRKTTRYCLAESIAGVQSPDSRWKLPWSTHHLLLLTATPHMGKDYPYFALWRLLEPKMLASPDAFVEFPQDLRQSHFIRRTKEEMVYLDGRPLYPKRISDTLGYELSQGDVSEQKLYDETTSYLRYVYNRAKLLNREAARLAMSVFHRRLASSTFALLCSFKRRIEKLDLMIDDIQSGKITTEQMQTLQARLCEDDLLDTTTADEEGDEECGEAHEAVEDRLLHGVVAASLSELIAEKEEVKNLLELARKVFSIGHESKFDKLREVLTDSKFSGEKIIVFTEHRDTLEFLARRLNGMGFTGQIAQIHGGMQFFQREEEIERFRKPVDQGGAQILICTDAAGEGINLQFCWIIVNYDVPWNPARLEQRMGRIHRYGQKHDPVVIMNLVAPSTREGRVLKVLLDKLEKIRKELKSDKVFDCIGRIFHDVSLKRYMELAITEDDSTVAEMLAGHLTKEQVQAMIAREKSVYGTGGDVLKELPRLRDSMEQEVYFRLLPGYLHQYIQQVAPLIDIKIDGDMDDVFMLQPLQTGAMDPLLPVLEVYPEKCRNNFSVMRPSDRKDVIWLHPGEPVFERLRQMATERHANLATRGAVLVDPSASKPYLFHMALLSVVRQADPDLMELAQEDLLGCRLVCIRQEEGAEISLCPVEHLLLLKGGYGLPALAQRLAVTATQQKEVAHAFLAERVAREMALERKKAMTDSLPEREKFTLRGFEYQEIELATLRTKHSEKARRGSSKANDTLRDIKRQQSMLAARRENALRILYREPELIAPGEITFVAHALVIPSSDPSDIEQHDANIEMVAMRLARAFEEAAGAKVLDVHTPELAHLANLPKNPGFDLLSIRSGNEKRSIEVKGRATIGDIEITANEWAKACNMRQNYWLYVVYDCATPNPQLVRVQDPFGKLLAKAKGSLLISPRILMEVEEL